jgi:hypothetical protein
VYLSHCGEVYPADVVRVVHKLGFAVIEHLTTRLIVTPCTYTLFSGTDGDEHDARVLLDIVVQSNGRTYPRYTGRVLQPGEQE